MIRLYGIGHHPQSTLCIPYLARGSRTGWINEVRSWGFMMYSKDRTCLFDEFTMTASTRWCLQRRWLSLILRLLGELPLLCLQAHQIRAQGALRATGNILTIFETGNIYIHRLRLLAFLSQPAINCMPCLLSAAAHGPSTSGGGYASLSLLHTLTEALL